MERDTTIATPGLVTDPGPFAGPEGALYEAENVVIPRPGNIQPRGRITWYEDTTTTGETPLHVAYWQSTPFVFYNSNTHPVRRSQTTSLTGPSALTAGKTWSAATRDRLLFTSDDGVYSIDSTSATTCRRAGLPRPFAPEFTTGAGAGWLTAGNATAYRVVYVRYVNGVPLFSPPSGYSLCMNTTGGAIAPRVTVWLSSECAVGDVVQIYRSPLQVVSPALPSDEMQLRITYTLTSTDVSNGYVQPTDLLNDATWAGPSLYSNASQQGILQSNYRPDYANDVAYYNGMAFYAGAKSRQRLSLSVTSVNTSSADPSSTIGGRVFAGATTVGSPTITGVAAADIAYLAVGQYITISAPSGGIPESADADFPASTTVVSWNSGAGTVTVSANALRTAAAHNVQVWDWVQIADGTYTRRLYANVTTTSITAVASFQTGGNPAAPEIAWTNSWLLAGNPQPSVVALYVDGTGAYGQTWTFETLTYPGATFTIKSCKPYAFSRYLDRTTGITSTQEGGTSRLSYSKVYEPEAIPILNYVDLGSSTNVIYRVFRLRDSLFVFTSEGVYRITGTDPEALSVDQFDPTCILWDPRLLASSHDVLWAFTTRGPCSVSDGGVQSICGNVRRFLDEQWDFPSGATSGSTLSPWAFASQAHDVVVFGAKRTTGTQGTTFTWRGYVYNIGTGVWTTWSSERTFRIITCAVPNMAYFGASIGAASYNFTESAPLTGDYINGKHAVVSSASGTTITINAGSAWTPTVGDAIADPTSSTSPVITVVSVTSATVFDVDQTVAYAPGAFLGWLEGYESRVKWQAKAFGDPSLMKRLGNVWLVFEHFRRGYDMTLEWESYNNRDYFVTRYGVGSEKTDTFTIASLSDPSAYDASFDYPLQIMRDVPSEIAEDWATRFGFKILRAGCFWVLGGMSLTYDHISDRSGHR